MSILINRPRQVVFMRTKLALGRSTVVSVLCGALFGFSVSYFLFTSTDPYARWGLDIGKPNVDSEPGKDGHAGLKWELPDIPSYLKQLPKPSMEAPINLKDSHSEHGDNEVARDLGERVRILCWIMTQPKSHATKAVHVKATWGRRCNYLLFMSSEADHSLPAIRLEVTEGRNSLWAKTKESFKYVYQHYLDKVDWVMKADDDTYVVVENLRYLLSSKNASDRLFLGCHFKPYVKQGYMSGGAGYVLSREAVRAFVEEALPKPSCRQDGKGAEDVEIGKCLEQVGVKIADSRDEFGRHRFFPLPPNYHLVPRAIPDDNWFWRYIYNPVKNGFDCCSDTTISFHYISPKEMYVLEFLIYHLQPYGMGRTLPGDATVSYHLRFPSQTPTTRRSPYTPSSQEKIENNLVR